jgi:hypothetical protein
MVTIVEVGEQVVPTVNQDYTDPTTDAEMTFPTAGVPGVVKERTTAGEYLSGDPQYDYLVEFNPAVQVIANVIEVDENGQEITTQQLFTLSVSWFTDIELGLATAEDDPFELDDQAVQQNIDDGKRRSTANLSTAEGINSQVEAEDLTGTSDYGGPDIKAATDTLRDLVGTLDEVENVGGKTSEEVNNQAYNYETTAVGVADNSDLFVEYIDNLYEFRQVQQEGEKERVRNSQQGAEQQVRADEEDAANSQAFNDSYLTINNSAPYTLTENFSEYNLSEEGENEILDSIEEVVNNLNNSLLGPDDPAPELFTIERSTSSTVQEEESTSEPLSPEEVE